MFVAEDEDGAVFVAEDEDEDEDGAVFELLGATHWRLAKETSPLNRRNSALASFFDKVIPTAFSSSVRIVRVRFGFDICVESTDY